MTPRPAVVGGFILGALALGVAGILFFGGTQLFATSSRAVVFFSESVAGLDVGSPVTFHGVRIGSVKRIAVYFSSDTMTAKIPVYLEFQSTNQLVWEGKKFGGAASDFERLVKAGLRAQLTLQSFVTGQLRVDIDFRPGTPAQTTGTITDIPEIPSIPSDLDQLRNQLAGLPLRELSETAQQALASLARLSHHFDAVLDPLAQSAMRTTDAATQTLHTTDDAVRQVQADAAIALHDLDSLLVDARSQLDARSGELSRTLAETDRAARQAEVLLDSLNGLAEPRAQFRSDLEATARDLAVSAGHLRNFAETVERNPNALVIGRSPR
ncbi:MlaD family protein [Burkholderia ubonensis]|uniref:MlaD family protein n=1 Tax=Burkholderia ubonensis TaxID=101571 RepID=UPI00075F5EBC|nr:MlaD family protein [Burkholderia ubonensis]KVA16974.1 paraquat-inducible protein B [Burkholderia ubonensis]KVA17402.1 paraquat-inducible protein B [Burkholderia ubonensis]KVA34520.1 paraquat-inducible protein B [Burkholderia ubonensis]